MMVDGKTKPEALKCPQCGAPWPHIEGQVVCHYCGSSLMITGREADQGKPSIEIVVCGMRLKSYKMGDPQGTGLECFRMLVPVGWQLKRGMTWQLYSTVELFQYVLLSIDVS